MPAMIPIETTRDIQKAVEEICTEKFCPSWTFEQYCLPLYCKKFLVEAESRGYKVRP